MPLGWKGFRSRNTSVPNLRQPAVYIDEDPLRPFTEAFEVRARPAKGAPHDETLRQSYADSQTSGANAYISRHSHESKRSNHPKSSKQHGRPRHHQGSKSHDVYHSDIQTTPLFRQPLNLAPSAPTRSRAHTMNEERSSFDVDPSANDAWRYHAPPSLPPSTPSQSPRLRQYPRLPNDPNSKQNPSSSTGGNVPTGRPRQSSTTSGSSAYTGYIDGDPSSPSSQGHFPVPPLQTPAPISAAPDNIPLNNTRTNESLAPSLQPNPSPRMRTVSSPLAPNSPKTRSPRTKPQPSLPPMISTPRYSPAFLEPYSSPSPRTPAFQNAHPSANTEINAKSVPASPVAMSVQPYSAVSPSTHPEYRGATIQYAPEPRSPSRSKQRASTSIVPLSRRHTRIPTVTQTHACMTL
jgi:hypothetical protein